MKLSLIYNSRTVQDYRLFFYIVLVRAHAVNVRLMQPWGTLD